MYSATCRCGSAFVGKDYKKFRIWLEKHYGKKGCVVTILGIGKL
jgi:hypothetical protein